MTTTLNHKPWMSYDPYESVKAAPSAQPAEDIHKIFWMVIRLGSAGITKIDAHPTREHATYAEACEEAERLAAKHPTHARGFAVLKACRIVKAEVSIKTKLLS
jgi:hypothetical protein